MKNKILFAYIATIEYIVVTIIQLCGCALCVGMAFESTKLQLVGAGFIIIGMAMKRCYLNDKLKKAHKTIMERKQNVR